ncbi:DUF779 domain-containing protein [Chenggangzhangella methanolivorans]|uniref:DUF779 domain-containing protein n=1 Tax=Chenggangzhangella methanolivorans TaxID=1437009 RepID=A0A9E6ULV5_9HYPH|nr:DUF779 domain-containing protein [Chenggangzhangella methanolivorans]QZN98563.1 DUF779 domain-containing protein [Chenggangzhangella methanolivorans]
MTSNVPLRVEATTKALDLIKELQDQHGDVLFHQSGGCCDGSSPMCYAVGDYMISDDDVKLGEVGGAKFYMSPSQFEYWKHTHLTLDVVPGRGGMFSLENGREERFHIRSRIFSDAEVRALEEAAA